MTVVVLGGAGMMGRVVARILAEKLDSDVVVADYNLDAAKEVVRWIGNPRATAVRVDVTDEGSLVAAIKGAGAVANAVTYYHNLAVMEACLKAQVPYADLGGFFHGTRKQLALNDRFAAAGVTAVLCIGSAPGITNMQAALGADGLSKVESVRIYDGSVPLEAEGVAWGYSLTTVIDEIVEQPFVFLDGEWVGREPLGGVEHYHFSDPIGSQPVHLSLHSEVATIPVTFGDRGIREVFFKINYFGLSPAIIDRLKLLADLGLVSMEPMEVEGVTVKPRDVTIAALSSLPAPPVNVADTREEIVTEVRGADGQGPVTVTVRTLCQPNVGWGLDAGAVGTASPIAIVCSWLASAELKAPGAHAPEAVVPARPLFKKLREVSGLETSISVERPLA
jgi:saccharopine dehydrogenase-like NADP-dependent oxidoreductase